jgi:hypothetical protein
MCGAASGYGWQVDAIIDALRLAGGVIGLGTAAFGMVIFVTGRAPRRTVKAWRSLREAGLWSVFIGSALVLLALSGFLLEWDLTWIGLTTLAAAMVVVALAVRFRPRR